MEITIKSKILGRSITVSRPGSSYLYVDLNGKPGTLGLQICEGGTVNSGSTLTYSCDDYTKFARFVRRWYQAFTKVRVVESENWTYRHCDGYEVEE